MAVEGKSLRMRIEAIVVNFTRLSGKKREIPIFLFGHRLMTGEKKNILKN
jgi:hypothetical protein